MECRERETFFPTIEHKKSIKLFLIQNTFLLKAFRRFSQEVTLLKFDIHVCAHTSTSIPSPASIMSAQKYDLRNLHIEY